MSSNCNQLQICLVRRELTDHAQNLRLFIANNSPTICPIDSLHFLLARTPNPKSQVQVHDSTYHRSSKVGIILFELLQRIIRIPSALHKLSNSIGNLLTLTTDTANRRDIIKDTANLIESRRVSGDFEFEFAALFLCVGGVVACLVFCCGFAGCGGCLFEDVKGAC